MRLKRWAVMAGVALAATVAALALAVHFLDPLSFARSLAVSVKADTGRDLEFGDVEVRLVPRPALELRGLRFGNAAWGSQPWLAEAGRAQADIDVRALLSGRLRITHIALADASVLLETDREGKGNWEIDSARAEKPAWLRALEIDVLALEAVALDYRDGKTGKTLSVRIDSAQVAAPAGPGLLRLTARASFKGTNVEAAGTIGTLAALIANQAAYPVDLEGKVGAVSVSLHGTLDKPRELNGFNLALGVQAPDLAALGAPFGVRLGPLGPVRGAARLTGSAAAPGLSAIEISAGGSGAAQIAVRGAVADLRAAGGIDLRIAASAADGWRSALLGGVRLPPFRASARLRDAPNGYQVDELDVSIADSRVSASLTVVQAGPRLRITGKAASPLIDLARLPRASASAPAPAAKAAPPPSTDYWKLADVDLDLDVARLIFPAGRELHSGSGKIALDNGRLTATALKATLGGARLKIEGSVADPQALAGLDLDVALQGDELAELAGFFGTPIAPVGPYQGRARLHGSRDALGITGIDAGAGRPGQNLKVSGRIEDAIGRRGIELAITASVGDSQAAGRLFGADLPPLPALRASARISGPQGGYSFDDLKLALGRTAVEGRVVFAPGEPRPRLTATLGGPLIDLSELPSARAKPGAANPLMAADVDATLRFDRVVLPDRRALGAVSGTLRLAAGALELKQFSVALDGASATLEGRIGEPLAPAGLDLMVGAKVERGAGLAAFTGLGLKNLPPFTASGKLTDVPNGYALAGLKLGYAAMSIAGDLKVTRGAKRFKVEAKASLPQLDVSAYMPSAGAESVAKPAAARKRAIPDLPLPLDVLRVVDADLDLRIDALKTGAEPPPGPLLVRAVLADGRLEAGPIQLHLAAGRTLGASATLDAARSAWALNIDATGMDLGQVFVRFKRPAQVTGGRVDLALKLGGRGKSLREILGSLNGDARITIGPHRIQGVDVNVGGGIVPRLFSLANPFQKTDPHTDVNCVAALLKVKDGIIASERNFAAETAKYNVVISGTVNLQSEAIDLVVMPIVVSGPGVGEVSAVVSVGGTLAAPAVGVNPVTFARSAASVGAAVALPGVRWIAQSLIRKATSDPHPCATALVRQDGGDPGPAR